MVYRFKELKHKTHKRFWGSNSSKIKNLTKDCNICTTLDFWSLYVVNIQLLAVPGMFIDTEIQKPFVDLQTISSPPDPTSSLHPTPNPFSHRINTIIAPLQHIIRIFIEQLAWKDRAQLLNKFEIATRIASIHMYVLHYLAPISQR